MVRIGSVVRLLMLAACLVPFTSPRQASASAPAAPVPPGGQEEDTEREEAGSEESARTPHPLPHRTPAAPRPNGLYSAHRRPTSAVRAPVALDPFRNGLGCPYRC